jgi:hypothetical protein
MANRTQAYILPTGTVSTRSTLSGVQTTLTGLGVDINGDSKIDEGDDVLVKCPDVTAIIIIDSKTPNLSMDTVCEQSVDLNSNPWQVCFTNYIRDLNNVCSLKYDWKSSDVNSFQFDSADTSSDKSSRSTSSNYTCICPRTNKSQKRTGSAYFDCAITPKWTVGKIQALTSTAKCSMDGGKTYPYSQAVNCYLKVTNTTSTPPSGSSSLTASCSGYPASANKGTTVEFTASVKSDGFAYGKCTSYNYF